MDLEKIARIDKTINNLCDWVDRNLSQDLYEGPIVPQMVSALAELIRARAESLDK
ncbi:hypothetical protein [Tissierella sp.]|jgi:hypothetical protein|uniref:hypothetical protein n=1 Tax=Tissierella sp. TaxID=41274 RepID=UPI003036526D